MSLFAPFEFTTLMQPWILSGLVGVFLLLAAEVTARAPGTLIVSTGEALAGAPGRRRALIRRAPAVLRALGLSLLLVAAARPIKGLQARKDRANVVDIMLCVDVSESMRAEDFLAGGQRVDRLDVTKMVVRDFIASRKDKPEDRYGLDRVGLVLYGSYAWTQCPLTLDYGVLERELDLARIAENSAKSQRTAIGSAVGLAVSRLRKSEAESKVIILLTDGQNNSGELGPTTAAQLAKEYGIRIYTIGVGSRDGSMGTPGGLFGWMTRSAAPVDEEALKEIAAIADGKYYRATDTASLAGAYAEISQLEATEIEIGDYYEHEEGFVPYAIMGALFLLASVFSRRLWFEPIP